MENSPDDPDQDDGLPFYLTPPEPCPYLPDRLEQRILTILPEGQTSLATPLLTVGFRRSQRMYYRPQCPGCTACLSVRIPVVQFSPDKNFRRILKRNSDIETHVTDTQDVDALFDLFQKYQQSRHNDGGMADMEITAFRDMLQDHPGNARLMHCTKDNRTLGVMLFDEIADGTSAVYSFFDTDADKRSLGTWMVLKLVEYTAAQHKPYTYLGYWIAASPKMSYKARFQPLQILIKNEWTDFKTASLD